MKNNMIPISVALVALVEIALMKKQYTMHAMNVNCQNISNQMNDELLYSKLVNTALSHHTVVADIIYVWQRI